MNNKETNGPQVLPVVRIDATAYFADLRLRQFRETFNLHAHIDCDSVKGVLLCQLAGVVTCLRCGRTAIVSRAAREDELQTIDQVRAVAERMVKDYRARQKTHELFYEWLDLSHIEEITKSSEAFPGLDALLLADLKGSLDAFLEAVGWGGSCDFVKR